MIWTKGAHQSATFETFVYSSKFSPNLYFERLLLLKVYKISAKKLQRRYFSWPKRMMQNLKKNWFIVSKMTRIWWKLTEHSKVWKMCTFIGRYSAKYLMFDLKKCRGVIFHDTEEWCKIWGKTDLWLEEWHEELSKFSPEHSKMSKVGLWWDPFVQSRKFKSLKFKEEIWVMTMMNNTKFEKELTWMKDEVIDMKEFDEIWPKHLKI